MRALFPPLSQNFGWSVEEQNYSFGDSERFPDYLPSRQVQMNLEFSVSVETDRKKLNHNANERDRRKKINSLYSSLRSLLPASDQSKKLSIPSTVSRALKYIPELQEQVKRLIQRKEELLLRVSRQGDLIYQEVDDKLRKISASISTVSATRLSDTEVMVQISASRAQKSALSDVLSALEEDGLLLMNASSSQPPGGRVFYSLHFHVDRAYNKLDCEVSNDTQWSLYEKRAELFR